MHMNIVPTTEQENFRIILIHSNTRDLLVSGEPGAFELPSVNIPARVRHAEHIVDAIALTFGLKSYCLFSVPPDSRIPHQYAFACSSQPAPIPRGFRWISAATVSDQTFSDSRDYLAYSRGFDYVRRCERNPDAGYFARRGWLQEILKWTQCQLDPRHMQLTGAYSQLNASATFSLSRLPTEQSAVWFKAVDRTAVPESSITFYLAQNFPAHVPYVIAAHYVSNGWLTEEVAGSHPDATSSDETWIAIANALADLQITTIGHGLHLLEAGCRDVRCASLRELVRPFFEAMADLMHEQKTTSPPALSTAELATLEATLLDALACAEEIGVPSTLGQLDFNLGNVVVCPSRIVFLDWAGACVGDPFFTFEYLLEGLRNLRSTDQALRDEVSSAYIRKWRSVLGSEELAEALAAAPLLAAFTYASAEDAWRNPPQLRDPARCAHLRSLTRRMNREAQTWTSRAKALTRFA
jgi:hypothetical protein